MCHDERRLPDPTTLDLSKQQQTTDAFQEMCVYSALTKVVSQSILLGQFKFYRVSVLNSRTQYIIPYYIPKILLVICGRSPYKTTTTVHSTTKHDSWIILL